MNGTVLRALFEDAFHQVLDNKVFRVLLVIACLLVAPSFVVGLREDRILILFGVYDISYESFLSGFNAGGRAALGDMQTATIQGIQELVVDNLCGTIGMIFCIAATAIFVPRLLERGYADTLFSKPVARWKIFLTQYVSGLLFVSMLAVVLVGGIYAGLLLVSGYNDPGFLWSIFTLSYLFALLHSVSMLIGVVTRSTVAAILLTTILFMFSGCVHGFWKLQEMDLGSSRNVTIDVTDPASSAAPEDEEQEAREKPFPMLRRVIVVLHYVLPKTNDADYIARMLRKATQFDAGGIEDIGANLTVARAEDGFELEKPAGAERRHGLTRIDLSQQPAVWVATDGGRDRASIEIRRRNRVGETPPDGRKPKKQSSRAAAEELSSRLQAEGAAPTSRQGLADRSFAMIVEWRDEAQARENQAAFVTSGDWMYEVRWTQRAGEATGELRAKRFDTFLARVSTSGGEGIDPYARRFGWTSELKYNAFFSLASSLAFAAVMLLLGVWKLARIDF